MSSWFISKTKILLILILFSLFLLPQPAWAKVLPQAKGATPIKSRLNTGIGIYPRLRADRRALLVVLSNLQNAKAVSYSLTYNTSEQQEGAVGSVNLANGQSSETEELLFGTCSKGVCRYHIGIKNARLEVSYTLKSGKKYIRKYKIKI